MKVVVLEKRGGEFRAYLKERPAVWGSGKSRYEAMGNMISAHAETFGIEVETPEKK